MSFYEYSFYKKGRKLTLTLVIKKLTLAFQKRKKKKALAQTLVV